MNQRHLHAARDLALVFVAAVIATFLAMGKGVTSLTATDLLALVAAGAAALLTSVLLVLTPLTRRYGVGADSRDHT